MGLCWNCRSDVFYYVPNMILMPVITLDRKLTRRIWVNESKQDKMEYYAFVINDWMKVRHANFRPTKFNAHLIVLSGCRKLAQIGLRCSAVRCRYHIYVVCVCGIRFWQLQGHRMCIIFIGVPAEFTHGVYKLADTLDFSPPFAGCIVYDISLPHFPQSQTFLCRLFPQFHSVFFSQIISSVGCVVRWLLPSKLDGSADLSLWISVVKLYAKSLLKNLQSIFNSITGSLFINAYLLHGLHSLKSLSILFLFKMFFLAHFNCSFFNKAFSHETNEPINI